MSCRSEPAAERADCGLASLTVRPTVVSPGDRFTVSSDGFVCDYVLPGGAGALGVSLVPDGQEAFRLGEASVEPDGAFVFEGRVPEAASAGEAWVLIDPPMDMLPPCPTGTEPTDCPAAPVGLLEIADRITAR